MEETKKALSFKEQKAALSFIFKYTKPQLPLFLTALVSGLLFSILAVITPFIIKDFMDNYLASGNTTMRVIYYYALLYMGLTVLRALVNFFMFFLFSQASMRTVGHVRHALYSKIHTLGMRYFDQKPTGWLISRITNDTDLFQFWVAFLNAINGIFFIISALIALFQLDARVASFILLFLPLIFLAIYLYQHFSSKIYSQMRAKLSELNTKLNENISGMRIIQQFRQEKRLSEEFEKTNNEYLELRKGVVRVNAFLLYSFVNLLLSLAVILALSLFGIQSRNQVVAGGVIYAFVSSLQMFFNPIGQTMDFLSVFTDGIVAADRIKGIMAENEYAPAQNPDAKEVITQGKIEFRNVSFSYDGENDVLKDISFVLNPGETLAFVGHTGSGKSSIINVFMRFYEFERGQILIDGKDIRDFPIAELRAKVGLVLQDAFLFVGDINSNIRMMNQEITNEEIIEAAKFTQAHHFISQLEGEYQAEVIEHGASYSSGQRQLLNFARTIVTDPKILVLDEATANIDTETETLIQEGLSNMRKGRTTIAIAHRLSTIKDAHQIIVLDKGQIVESGNHEELIAKDGYYAELYRLQTEKV